MARKARTTKPTFDPKPLEGKHSVTADGKHVMVGTRKFKRTVLPSVAEDHLKAEALAEELDAMDKQQFSEKE